MNRLLIPLLLFLTHRFMFSQDNLYVKMHVVIADTSLNYYALRTEMFDLSMKLQIKIDTMGRGFNKEKNLICLPDNSEDEIYAGDYFPRRMPTEAISLEYLVLYNKKARENTIGIVIGIYEKRENAELILKKLKKYSKKAHIIDTEIYMGCLH